LYELDKLPLTEVDDFAGLVYVDIYDHKLTAEYAAIVRENRVI